MNFFILINKMEIHSEITNCNLQKYSNSFHPTIINQKSRTIDRFFNTTKTPTNKKIPNNHTQRR